MNVADERSRSCWIEDVPAIEAPPLQSDQMCDVVVIGSGIAGLSTAYEVCRFGRSVIVIDRGKIGSGMTARTTAHLATELDDFYSELIRVRGEDEASRTRGAFTRPNIWRVLPARSLPAGGVYMRKQLMSRMTRPATASKFARKRDL
jgi:choline dehydrogenase-like flavoprotein